MFNVQANSYGHIESVNSPDHTYSYSRQFRLSGLPILRVQTVTCNWQQPFLNQQKEEND